MFHPIDELPFWSAPFGLTLLEAVRIREGLTILDVGCGTGFPLLELAERAGAGSLAYGLDPSPLSLEQARKKMTENHINNVVLTEGVAERLPFDNSCFDLITSNNGLNNTNDLTRALAECFRVTKPGAQMVITMNLPDTMKEFYSVFEEVLKIKNLAPEVSKLYAHIDEKRKPAGFLKQAIRRAGFSVITGKEEQFAIRYASGSAFLHHSLIRNGFLTPWKDILPASRFEDVFQLLETMLNDLSQRNGSFLVPIPFICLDCKKPS
jgi:ubiquinone/menaquinone biosynthesis C-methylase UbiE